MKTLNNAAMLALLLVAAMGGGTTTTTHLMPNGNVMTITSHGSRPPNARVWSADFKASATHDSMSANESGSKFSDPEGKSSGSGTWSGMKRSFYEGEKVTISMNCQNLSVSFFADFCADGKASFSRGIRNPWTPDRSSQTFDFVFQPMPGRDKVVMRFESSPSLPGTSSSSRSNASWIFSPGAAAKETGTTKLSAVDAQVVSANFLMRGSSAKDLGDISAYVKDSPAPTGVAADGSSLVVLRAPAGKADTATFTLTGGGGALYPMIGKNPLKSVGVTTLQVPTRESNGKHYALALYRPPSYFGRGNTYKPLDFKVKFAGGGESTLLMKLVPPPIVLVHGTYDNPKFCYEEHSEEDDTTENLAPTLRKLGYDVYCVDWEETNGSKDPSEFQHNRHAVYKNPGGIKEALASTRRKGIIVSQADVICHSQGGVITRTYCRGFPFSVSMPPTHPHYNNPTNCAVGDLDCWFHRADNYFLGDIHRLITISTTHRGSHVLNVFKYLDTYPDKEAGEKLTRLLVSGFLQVIDNVVSGITTGGVKNQIPDSLELQLIGPTPVPSHAIACVASDEDTRNQRRDSMDEVLKFSELGMGNYWNKLYKVWLGTTNEARDYLFVRLCKLAGENGMPDPDGELQKYRDLASKVTVNEDARNVRMDALIYQMRKIVFQGLENDCTVGIKSSFGGLGEPFRTRVPGVLHGWAPRYRAIQMRVLKLLVGDGSDFDYDGFPGYSGIKSSASSFAVVIPPQDLGEPVSDSDIPLNPSVKTLPRSTGAGEAKKPETGGTFDLAPEKLGQPESWKDNSTPGSLAKFEKGRLTLASPNEVEAEASTFVKAPLKGDFDLVIDYKLEAWKVKGEGQIQFDIMLSPAAKTVGEDYLLLSRMTTTEGDLIGVAPWKELPGDEKPAATAGGGKIRVVRKGAAWKISQWDGRTWKEVHTFESAANPEVYLGFGLSTAGDAENAKVSLTLTRGE